MKEQERLIEKFQVNPKSGLTNEQVKNNQEKYGLNKLKEKKKKGMFRKFLDQFKDVMIVLLLISAAISLVFGFVKNQQLLNLALMQF